MKTNHRVLFEDAGNMDYVESESVDLLVTSPPYPMIEMWDEVFSARNSLIGTVLRRGDGPIAFELMHRGLAEVWTEVSRVLKDGAVACVNVGDATRSLDGRFGLYTNHAVIQDLMQKLGFVSLPSILWRKQTNAPNKFMGSGMLPPSAYATLEHEYILIFRKGWDKRPFASAEEKRVRRESAYFWEERNVWFSDVWTDLKGTGQNMAEKEARKRSGAFPFELAYRLVNMFSVKGDLVLDPFLGVGTTMFAAMASARNSIGFEIDSGLEKTIASKLPGMVSLAEERTRERLSKHVDFIGERFRQKGPFKHRNIHYGFPVVTAQEKELVFNPPASVEKIGENRFLVLHHEQPAKEFVSDWEDFFAKSRDSDQPETKRKKARKPEQAKLFEN